MFSRRRQGGVGGAADGGTYESSDESTPAEVRAFLIGGGGIGGNRDGHGSGSNDVSETTGGKRLSPSQYTTLLGWLDDWVIE